MSRPLKFKTVKEMRVKIDAYFKQCDLNEEPLTITGLALALDCDPDTLLNYGKKEEFFGTVKRAKLKIEHYLELSLYRPTNVTGIIFNLKNNFGWKDKQEVEHGGKNIQIVFNETDKKLCGAD